MGSKAKTEGAAGESNTDSALPEILPCKFLPLSLSLVPLFLSLSLSPPLSIYIAQELSSSLDSSQLSAAAAMPPDLLLESESKPAPSDPSSAVTRDTARDEGQQQVHDISLCVL